MAEERGGGENDAVRAALSRRVGERSGERPGDRPTDVEMDGKLRVERVAALPVQLDVRVPVPDFRVSDLLGLEPGRVVASEWPSTDDVPLSCGDVRLVWTEFEVVDQTLAVRVTRLV
jgi:flagellar motor switch protein FliM